MDPSRIVCLPGFGDPVVDANWVTDLADAHPDSDVVAIDWPGLWTRWHEPVSYTRLVDDACAAVTDDTVIVGHSLGGRVALHVAARAAARAAVAICSPARLRLNTGPTAERWRQHGVRPTHRRALNAMAVTYELPVVFLDELDTAPEVAVPACPTLLVFGADDPHASAGDWDTGPADVVTVADCDHMFMHDDTTRVAVVDHIGRFLARL